MLNYDRFIKKKFSYKDDIIYFDITDDSTKKVTEFYDESPFPNYKDADNKASILERGDKNLLAKQLKNLLDTKKCLEVGCGTGQLSIYFSIWNK